MTGIVKNGTAGNDNLAPTTNDDYTLNGFEGNDVLSGGNGADVVNGGDGEDFINVRGKGADTVDGGNGIDRVTYYSSAGPLNINLETTVADDGSGTPDTLINVERISGNNGFADIIIGRADTNETLYGNGGNDTLDGGVGGSDTAGYSFTLGAGVQVNLALGTSSGIDGVDVLTNFENIEGSRYNDTLTGDSGANILMGLNADDVLTGGGGNDTLLGGAGNDTAIYSGNRSDYTVTTLANGDLLVQDNRNGSPDGTDTVRGVKTLQFADAALTMVAQERAVNSGTAGHQVYQSSAMLFGTGGGESGGGYVVVFRAADADGEGVYMRLFGRDDEPRGNDVLVNTTTAGDQRAPTVAALLDGGFVVMWDTTPETGAYPTPGLMEIRLQRFDADGNKVGGEVDVNTTTAGQQRFPQVTYTSDGGYLAVWQSRADGTGNGDIHAQKFGADGARSGTEMVLNTTTAGNQLSPLVRHVGADGMLVVWQGTLADGSTGYAQQLLDSNGAKVGAEQIAYSAPAGTTVLPAHHSTTSDGYVLSWIQVGANGVNSVMARSFNNDGSARGEAFTVASGERYLGNDVIVVDDGRAMMVWDVTHADGSSAIVGRHFNPATGQASGQLFVISDNANGGVLVYPTLSAAGTGDIVVSWNNQGNAILPDSGGVYQQLINGNGDPEFGVFDTGAAPAGTTMTVQTVAGGNLPQTTATGAYVLNSALSSGATVNLPHLALSGTAAFGTTVTIMSGATELVTVGVDDAGRWAADLKQLGEGLYHLRAVVKDAHGNASAPSASFDVTVDSPAVIDGTSGADNAAYWNGLGASSAAQTLNGGDGNDTLDGGGGSDTLNGGAGDDTYLVKDGAVVNEAPGAGVDIILSNYGMVMPDNVENLTISGNTSSGSYGNALDNLIRTGASGDYINGAGGNDTMYGNGGGDNFQGGAGNDSELGGDGDDFFIGGAEDSGNDLMDGGAGRDFFNLSTGQDTILGGAGDEDTLYAETAGATHGVTIDLATNVMADNGFGESGVVSGIEELEGTHFADKLTGSAAGEIFTSHGGNDTIDGAGGFDGVIYGGGAAFTGGLATGTGTSADGTIQFSNIEALGGGSGNDSLAGNSGNNVLAGMQGNDTMTGGGGNDTIYGGGGADTAVYAGNKANYTISTVNGVTTVKDNRAGSPDGIDSLEGVRTLKFADGNVELKAVDQIVSSNTGGFQIYQSTAANWYRDAGFLQVFRAADGNGHGLYARLFDSDGHAQGGDILINANNIAGDQRAPVVSSLVFGGYAVAYHSNTALDAVYADTGWDVMVQVLGADGQPVGAAINVGTTPGVAQRVPTVTGLDYGGFVVTWQSAQAGDDKHLAVYARSFGSDGQPTGPEVLVGEASDSNQSGPAVTSQADGGYVIAWSGITPSGHYGHMEQRFDAGGAKVGAEQVVFDTTDYAATLSVVHTSRMADGGHVLSWVHDPDGAGSGDDVVMARRYDASGNPTGAAFVVAGAGMQASATVLGLSDGSYMVVWDVENADGSSAIMGRRYSGSDDSALTAEFKISNSPAAGVKLFPTLAEFQNGQIVVSWGTQGMLALTDSGGIYQQIIDFNGQPLFYAGDSSTTKPAATTLTVQTVVGGVEPVLDPAYLSAAYYLKDPALSSGASVSNSHLVISGTAAAGSVITVKAGTTVVGTAAVDDDGRWALDVKSLATGAYALTATVTDLFGKVSAASPAFNLTINNGITGTAGDDNEQYWVTRGANGTAQSLTGLAGNDTLNGGGGNDTLTGGAGDDVYIVNNTGVVVTEALNGGTDKVVTSISLTLAANVENGELSTNTGATLTGNALANELAGGDGNDVLNGLAGSDTMWGGAGDDTFVVDVATDVVEEGKYAGKDTVQVAFAAAGTYTLDDENVENAIITGTAAINVVGNDADNLLTGNAVGNVLSGGLGSDTLNGMGGNDTMNGGDGDYGDTYVVDAVGDVINEIVDGGIDTVQTALASYVLNAANVENLVYTGAAAFNGTGNAGNNEIKGGVANDTLSGGAGNDTLVGAAGNDSLLGGDGDDVLKPSGGASGVDVVDGSAGADTVVLLGNYADFMRSRVTDTDTKLVNAITGETVTVRNVEQVQFADGMYAIADLIANSASLGADTIVGTDGNDTINAGAGADLMIGGLGDDTYQVDNKDDVILEQSGAGKDVALVNLAAAGTYTLAANVEEATVTSAGTIAINLLGNAENNTLVGNAGANLLVGNEGNDTLVAGAGTDTLVGGLGDDTYLVDSAADVITETAVGGVDTVVTGTQSYTLGAFVENLVYVGGGGVNATGNTLDNTMSGWESNDTLNGDAGNDELSGYLGNDSLLGGAGDDTLLGEQGNDTLNGGAGSDALEGGAGNDSLLGGDGDDWLLAGTGVDVADGGAAGDDVLELLGDYDSYTITRPNATDLVLVNAATGEHITARNIEQFAFADGIKTYGETILNTYSAFGDALVGSMGIDSIDGLGGSDTMAGLEGDDIYVVDVAGDVIAENADEGIDLVQVKFTAAGTYVLGDEVENATVVSAGTLAVNVTGNDLDNILTGNAGANKLTGNGGNDQLVGGAGNDTMAGGDGDDLYVVDAAGDVVIEAVEAGWDMVKTSLAAYTLAANVEDLEYTGIANFAGTGNALDNDIRAGAGNDTLNGGLGDDYLIGNEGSDSLLGGDGSDMLFAGTGANDFVDGGAGDNAVQLLGNFADYTRSRVSLTDTKLVNALTGESLIVRNVQTFFFDDDEKSLDEVNFNLASVGDDVLEGTADNDSLNGLTGKDTMSGLEGDDTYVVDVVSDAVVENPGEGDDLVNVAFTAAGSYTLTDNVERATVTSTLAVGLVGNTLNNTLTGNAAANTLTGNAGDDTLAGGAGNDTMIGGDGNDVYAVDAAGDAVTEGAGVGSGTQDVVETTLAAYTLAANVEWLRYTGTGNFNGTGNAGNNLLAGGNGNDTLNGGLGDDYLTAGIGNDSMAGGDGNDTLFGGGGSDTADGGLGDDTVEFLGNFADYSRTRISATETRIVDLESGDAVVVRNVENFTFQDGPKTLAEVNFNLASVGDDALVGTSGKDSLNGLAGKDTMSGLQGDDTYFVDVAGDVIIENPGEGTDRVNVAFTAAGTYTMGAGVENATITSTLAVGVVGNELNNVLMGNAAANTLTGNAGNDYMDGGAGSDTMIGGTGDDIYVVDAAGDVVTEGAGAGTDWVVSLLATYTLAANVEKLGYEGEGNFNATGNALANEIGGGFGKDTLSGGAGNDTLYGNSGNDSLLGGDGDDLLDAGEGTADLADGGAGADTLQVEGDFDDFVITRLTLTDTKLVSAETGESVTIRNIENVLFGDGLKTLAEVHNNVVSVGDDVLQGTAGDDSINGLAGKDTMSGLDGDDVYFIDVAGDYVIESADQGEDLVNVGFTAAGSYTLTANVENATVTSSAAISLVGNAEDNTLTGNAVANTLTGNAGNDVLIGGAGSDTMIGGEGDDIYVVDAAGDVVTETVSAGTDAVQTALAAYTLAANVEHLVYTGKAAFNGSGNALANELTGGVGNDTLSGGVGNDTLFGGGGNDSLLGGDGNDDLYAGTGTADVADGGAGSDTLHVDGVFAAYIRTRLTATDTRLVNNATGESITIRNVESVSFDDGSKTIDQVNDNLASAGNDTLTGTAGNDTVNGGTGADDLSGGDGDDTYVVDVAGDVVHESIYAGTDLVQVAYTAVGTFTMGDNIENATVTSTLAVNLVGNISSNVLTGNAAANKLEGGDGNDTLIGGAGTDNMIGGNGDDVYVVDVAADVVTELGNAGSDRVETALASYTLGLNVEVLAYTGAANFSGTGNALANELYGRAGNDTLNGGLGNDILGGGGGNDSLLGGDGDDQLDAGTGVSDVVDGGLGSDVLYVQGDFAAYTRTRVSATDTRLVNAATGESVTFRGIESVDFNGVVMTLAEVHDNLVSAGNDVLTGTAGIDSMNGLAGNDTMSGLAGNDTYVIDAIGDVVIEAADEGTDQVNVGYAVATPYTLGANVENATVTSAAAIALVGNALDNVLTGNAAANTLTGNGGNDTLSGGAGNDSMAGGLGNDVYVVDAAGDVVFEDALAGSDRVDTTLAAYTLGAAVENLSYLGAAAFKGTGNALDNVIVGGSANDTLSALAGNDTLIGGAGNDTLSGGADADTFVFNSLTGVDTITDFVTNTDKIAISQAVRAIGDGDTTVEDAVLRASAGGFSADAELVVFSQNTAATISNAAAAAVIGSATGNYTLGQQALFVVDNGTNSYVYVFKSSGTDALVSAAELTQVAILTGNSSTALTDFQFV